jgi:ketosteroid isomerase-like protein
MSQENVEIVRGMYDAYKRGDFASALAYFDPSVEWSEPPDNPGARTWHGREGVQGALTTWAGAWEDYRYELRELIDCDDKVLLAAWQSGRGKGSGVNVSEDNFCVFTLREGAIVRQQMFRRRLEALEAAGLSE